jgi:hypothetical protein
MKWSNIVVIRIPKRKEKKRMRQRNPLNNHCREFFENNDRS